MARIPLSLIALAICSVPAYAQDRTPPAGSYDALAVPSDVGLRTLAAPEAYSLVEARPRQTPHAIARMPHIHR